MIHVQMGIKFLSLHTIPWCLHLMGSHMSCMQLQEEAQQQQQPVETIKLIRSDGVVKIYHRPIHVSELMLEFPKHLVCRSDSFYIGQKIPALKEDDKLQLGHKYFLLPTHFFQSVLSFVTIASFASSQNQRNAFVKKAATCQPFDIQKTPSGCLRIRVSDEFLSQLIEEAKIKEHQNVESETSTSEPFGRVCTTAQLQKDYKQLVRSRHWEPKLETIKESHERRKLYSSFGMKRRKKSLSKSVQKCQTQAAASSTKQPSSRIKIKLRSRKKHDTYSNAQL